MEKVPQHKIKQTTDNLSTDFFVTNEKLNSICVSVADLELLTTAFDGKFVQISLLLARIMALGADSLCPRPARQ